MTVNNISMWIGIVSSVLIAGVGWGQNNEKISNLEKEMEDQDELKMQAVRLEERQKQIQQDVRRILEKLESSD